MVHYGKVDVGHPRTPVIEADVVTKTTFAAAQNAVPILKRILIRNPPAEPLAKLRSR